MASVYQPFQHYCLLKNYVSLFQSTPLLDYCLKSVLVIGLNLNTSLTTTTQMFLLKHLTTINSESQTHLCRFELLPESKLFCKKLTILYSTQYPDLLIT